MKTILCVLIICNLSIACTETGQFANGENRFPEYVSLGQNAFPAQDLSLWWDPNAQSVRVEYTDDSLNLIRGTWPRTTPSKMGPFSSFMGDESRIGFEKPNDLKSILLLDSNHTFPEYHVPGEIKENCKFDSLNILDVTTIQKHWDHNVYLCLATSDKTFARLPNQLGMLVFENDRCRWKTIKYGISPASAGIIPVWSPEQKEELLFLIMNVPVRKGYYSVDIFSRKLE